MKHALLSIIVVAVLVTLALRMPSVSGELAIDNPRLNTSRDYPSDLSYPSILRFVSRMDGQPAFGLVTQAEHGLPREVLNLTAQVPALGSGLASFVANDGFALAERLFNEPLQRDAHFLERIDEEELADRILPVVGVTQEELDQGDALIVGVGANYLAHREEAAVDYDRFAFPKPVEPTGAYRPLSPSLSGYPDAGELIDYEVEIGFVLLQAIDLEALPSQQDLYDNIALFLANDITDRLPQIIHGDAGYTRAKSHPGYLSIGPWMVHGKHLQLDKQDIAIHLRILEQGEFPGGSTRQHASSSQLVRGTSAIIEMLSQIHDQSVQLDNHGMARPVIRMRDNRAVLPAGTIILTGTPAGTAIEAPGTWDRARAFVRGNFTMSGARRYFAQHSIAHKQQMGYLATGDKVESWAEHLGLQRWQVAAVRSQE